MLALLLAVALFGLTALSLLLAGVVVAVLTAIAVLNLSLLALGLRTRRPRTDRALADERWRPSAFGRLPEPPFEVDDTPSMTIHRG
jgi:hypothetical protein